MPRAFLFVMDSVGIGGATDAAAFGDAGANTLLHIAQECHEGRANDGRSGPLRTPNLAALGLGDACRLACGIHPPGLGHAERGVWGAGCEVSPGKDTITGHWELAGAPLSRDWHYFPHEEPTFPEALTARLVKEAGLPGILGDRHASGTGIIAELGEESVATGKPILYTSADSVLQIAAHEGAFGLDRLYALCEAARAALDDMGLRVGRVIARPFAGEGADGFRRTANRHDYAVPPPEPTLCDRVVAAGGRTVGIGKIQDILAGQGVSENRKGPDDMALFDHALDAMREAGDGDLVFANFVEFDSLWGHRRDPSGYARALEAFDARLPEALEALAPGDLLIVTADHGNDPTWPGTDHTRERVPVLAVGPGLAPGRAGLRRFADVAETLAFHLGLAPGRHGASFLAPGADGAHPPRDGERMTTLAALPKIELHLHIEGAAPPALVRGLAARKGLSTEGLFDADGGYAWSDFTEFLGAYDRAAAMFVTPDEQRDLAEAVLRECAAHGVIYAELAISSDHVAEGDRVRWDEYLAAISEGADAAEREAGIVARFIPTCIRGLGPERAIHAARLAVAAEHPRIVGLGLAGDERIFAPADFSPAFDMAREAGLKLTAHAGEFAGPQSVRAALDGLRPHRIDHGVRATEDPALLARIIDERVHLAVCPGSNVALGVYPDWESHPIRELRALGADLSVSTDDPPFFHTDMSREYEMLARVFGWTEGDFRDLARASLAAAFCDEATKAALAPRLSA